MLNGWRQEPGACPIPPRPPLSHEVLDAQVYRVLNRLPLRSPEEGDCGNGDVGEHEGREGEGVGHLLPRPRAYGGPLGEGVTTPMKNMTSA